MTAEQYAPPQPDGGMAAHPPQPDLPPEDEGDRNLNIILHQGGGDEPQTFDDFLRALAASAVANFLGLVAAAAVVSYAWQHIEILTLPTLSFGQAFTALVVLRVLALVTRL